MTAYLRLIVAGVVLAALALSHLTTYRWGKRNEHAQWLASVAASNEEALRLERARQSAAVSAARDAAAREAGLRASAARARGESAGLRDDLDAANAYAKQSRAAAERVASVATELLGRCTASYLGVAEEADRADSEARQLRQAWPRN